MPESEDQVIKPERVLVLSKSMCVRWRDLGAHMHRPGVTSLDDIMRIDLHYIMRCNFSLSASYGWPAPLDKPVAGCSSSSRIAFLQTLKSGAHQH